MRFTLVALTLLLAQALGAKGRAAPFSVLLAQAAPSATAPSANAAASAEMTPRDGAAVLYPHTDAAPARATGGWGGTGTAVLVIVLGAAGGWMLWNKLRGAGPVVGNEHKLTIAETRSLGNRQFLVVAAYQDRKFLLGVVPGRIDLLAPLDGGPAANPPASL